MTDYLSFFEFNIFVIKAYVTYTASSPNLISLLQNHNMFTIFNQQNFLTFTASEIPSWRASLVWALPFVNCTVPHTTHVLQKHS